VKKNDKYNRLTAVRFIKRNKNRKQYWLFHCECGSEKVIEISNVKSGNTKSCGCLQKEVASKQMMVHGMFKTKTYVSWQCMLNRCLNNKYKFYKNYGGRGIKVCDRWKKFENFYEDMRERPSDKSLDRINNNGNYYKENCRWATDKEQCNNRRNNLLANK